MDYIADIMHKQMLDDYQSEKERDYLGISAAGYCTQKNRFYVESGFKRGAVPQRTLIKFLTGNAVHEAVLSLLWRARGKDFTYRKAEKEVVVKTPAGEMKGHLDLRAKRNGQEFVADLKVVGIGKFTNVKKNGPDQHYMDQVMLYCDAEGVDNGVLVYLCVETGEVLEFPVSVQQSRVRYLKMKYDDTMSGEISDYQCPEGTWECNYCEFAHKCPIYQAANPNEESEKTGETAPLPMNIELEYIEADRALKEAKERVEELKGELTKDLPAGANGKGTYFNATYIKPAETVSYDKKQLEALIPSEQLEPAKKVAKKSGYYRIGAKK